SGARIRAICFISMPVRQTDDCPASGQGVCLKPGNVSATGCGCLWTDAVRHARFAVSGVYARVSV
ncbi:MAG: hypothetical protein LBK65_04355, partial [Tannerellaceae bacterium]|nr:hypothetical protein [Tannerellaceae bacterium]